MTPPPRARLAVVGLGKMGIMHTSMIRTCPKAELVALCDLDPKLVEHVRSMGAPVAGFSDLAAMLDAARPDGVVVATPQFTHRAIAEACLSRGVAVMTEKPLAHTLDEATALLRAADAAPGVPFGVGLMKGHDDFYLLGATLASGMEWDRFIWSHGSEARVAPWFLDPADGTPRGGALGRVASFRASVSLGQVFAPPRGWTFTKEKAGGGVLINTGIHLVYLLRLFFGRLVRVSCLASPIHAATEDTLSALVVHEAADGARVHGTVHVSWSTPECATEATEIFVEGSEGWLWFEDNTIRLHRHRKGVELTPRLRLRQGWTTWERGRTPTRAAFNLSPDYGGEGYANEVEDFAEAVVRRGAPRFGAAHGWEIQAAIEAYYRSAAHDGAPTHPHPLPERPGATGADRGATPAAAAPGGRG